MNNKGNNGGHEGGWLFPEAYMFLCKHIGEEKKGSIYWLQESWGAKWFLNKLVKT